MNAQDTVVGHLSRRRPGVPMNIVKPKPSTPADVAAELRSQGDAVRDRERLALHEHLEELKGAQQHFLTQAKLKRDAIAEVETRLAELPTKVDTP